MDEAKERLIEKVELSTEVVGTPRGEKPEDNVAAYALWVNPTITVPAAQPLDRRAL